MATETLSGRPLKELVRNVASSVAESQAELDRRAMATQQEVERAIEQGELGVGFETPHYRFSSVDVDVKLTMSVEGTTEEHDDGRIRFLRPQVVATPAGPSRDGREYEAEMLSEVHLTMVPVPRRP